MDILGRKLDVVIDILRQIAERLKVELGEKVQSPGYVYTTCRWLRISKIEVKGGVYHTYVYCAHPRRPMTKHGCLTPCPYLDTSDKPTGSGAFVGMVLGGLAGLILGGPSGVIVGVS